MASTLRTRTVFTLALATCLAAFGCESAAEDETVSTSASAAPAGSAAATGPCAKYAGEICAKAGSESQTCETFTAATGVMAPSACEAGLKDIATSMKLIEAKGAKCDDLIKKLCADIGPKTDTCKMVTEQTKNFPPERCEMMLTRYGEVVEDLKQREAMNEPLSDELQKAIAAGDAPSFGPESAKVTLVEFSDFQCPYCARSAEVTQKLKDKYEDKVRFVFRQYPLPMHKEAPLAAQASLAAHEQGKFWEYHDKLFENQQQLGRDDLIAHAKATGLDLAKFKQALESDKYEARIKEDMDLGQKVSVRGTPTLFLNGERVSNPGDFESISKQIDAALSGSTG